MKNVLTMAVLVLLAGCVYLPTPDLVPSDAGKAIHAAPSDLAKLTVKLEVIGTNQHHWSGSGVWISQDMILTDYHVVREAAIIAIRQRDLLGIAVVAVVDGKFWKNEGLDLAVVVMVGDSTLRQSRERSYTYAKLLTDEPEIYSPCAAVGHALGLDVPVYTVGHVQSNDYEGRMLYTAAGIFGDSGGGVFVEKNGEWRLVSVCQCICMDEGTPITFLMLGCKYSKLKKFLVTEGQCVK